ncbi:MAG TPA: SDR family oxidoreductase [Kofleriaceae bacterium]|nr:SDR family oxidoreductase [Kofleriaceae bacterium]
MQGKTVVITGASSGIGLETARALATKGARVMMVVRSEQRGQDAIANIRAGAPDAKLELVLADLYSLAEVRKAGAELRERCEMIDVLVNNAGLIHHTRELTVDGFERTFALNHLAAFLLSYELRERLAAAAPARIVTVSSMGHKFARFEWDDIHTMSHWKGETAVYGTSKLCNLWFARESARRLAPQRITSNALHPGAVASNFGASGSWLFKYGTKLVKPFLKTVEDGARTSVYLACSPDVATVSGEYFVNCQIKTPSSRARDDESARRLWELSERLCGISWS